MDLGEEYPEKAASDSGKYGGSVRPDQRAIDLVIENRQIKRLKLQNSKIDADLVLLAKP